MSTSKHIDKICVIVIILTLAAVIAFMFGKNLGLVAADNEIGYESRIFSTDKVHTIDIVMDDWEGFIESCEDEEYAYCTVAIDGEKVSNIGIRAKGNTSLTNVSSMDSQRYSLKLEFDHYQDGQTYYGLDKLCLNNLIQDNTMMKDYLVYQMMGEFGVESPLCSYVYVTVNGEDWGLFLAVESVEDSFLERNYGGDSGNLYKPDSMSFGGGRGNGKDFNMDDFDFGDSSSDDEEDTAKAEGDESADGKGSGDEERPQMPEGDFDGEMPQMPEGDFDGGEMPEMPEGDFDGEMPQMPEGGFNDGEMPEMPEGGFDREMPQMPEGGFDGEMPQMPEGGFDDGEMPEMPSGGGQEGGPGGGGMGSDDVKLKYIDDDIDSYSNIFDNAKTDASKADKERLIESLKNLSDYSNLEETLDIEEVLRYFVIHNFVVNGDSYTGSMVHNYYLHEDDGILSMIPWDYNLAFGTFQGGDASTSVNSDIDSPVQGGDVDDRPMVGWIFSDEEYTDQYHELFAEFLEEWYESGKLETLITETADMIRPYVEKDPTKFCTTEEFEKGVTAIKDFVNLRFTAVSNQLQGDDTAVDTTGLSISDMGTMSSGMGGLGDHEFQPRGQHGNSKSDEEDGDTSEDGKPEGEDTEGPKGGKPEGEDTEGPKGGKPGDGNTDGI